MNPLTEAQIRASFVNASKRERTQALLPEDFAEIDWPTREFLGWRDRKLPQVGYVVCELEDEIVLTGGYHQGFTKWPAALRDDS